MFVRSARVGRRTVRPPRASAPDDAFHPVRAGILDPAAVRMDGRNKRSWLTRPCRSSPQNDGSAGVNRVWHQVDLMRIGINEPHVQIGLVNKLPRLNNVAERATSKSSPDWNRLLTGSAGCVVGVGVIAAVRHGRQECSMRLSARWRLRLRSVGASR